jgi:hypothetical protein
MDHSVSIISPAVLPMPSQRSGEFSAMHSAPCAYWCIAFSTHLMRSGSRSLRRYNHSEEVQHD